MKLVLNTLQGNKNSTPPIWLLRQAGRYLPEYRELRRKVPSFMDFCFHEDYATQVTLQPLQRFELDAAILFSDILVIPHVLGQRVQVIEKIGPVLDPLPSPFFEQAKDIDLNEALEIPLRILTNIRRKLPSTKTVIGFSGSPWTIATYMLEEGKSTSFKKIKHLLESRNPIFTQTMAVLEESVGTFLCAQITAGADVIQIFDSWAKAVPEPHQKEWIVDPIRRIISRIRVVHPTTPIIYYGRGVSELYPQIVNDFSNIAFGVDESVPISVMKDKIQKLGPVQGNLSPQILVEGGEVMRNTVRELLTTFQETPYVFNLGHGIVPQTPVHHVGELVDLVKGNEILR
ncbi:MAG: uroporphyrinogen decarboxylase [Alphaproteobacteria bacterium]|jgi:uroporphyrinogen decarboxylase|nr:uroporphyrinogen decarboxylase [Alphaproteobacteria bacterium]